MLVTRSNKYHRQKIFQPKKIFSTFFIFCFIYRDKLLSLGIIEKNYTFSSYRCFEKLSWTISTSLVFGLLIYFLFSLKFSLIFYMTLWLIYCSLVYITLNSINSSLANGRCLPAVFCHLCHFDTSFDAFLITGIKNL
jgi:pheromone shutdown protein TraB